MSEIQSSAAASADAAQGLLDVALRLGAVLERMGHSRSDAAAIVMAAYVDATATLAALAGLDPERFVAMIREAFDARPTVQPPAN